ncbi:uncharacterized protein BJX67DRAFT_377930 [Aspergillus lucknowensis]|uniref:Short chain dehydrogenase n=1 Tax=Aspergillus lucknowensis TaxID=176173 RepID=A0ABR4M1A0_9EURO
MPRPIALITGANQGIGRATAESLASTHNYHVIIGSRNASAGELVASTLRAAGHAASSLQLDLTSEESIQSAVATIEHDFGHLDVLINNAAILIDVDKALTPWERYARTFTTNVVGTAVLTELLVPLLRRARARGGLPRVVFLSSRMGSLHTAMDKSTNFYAIDYKAYDASKAAVNMLMLNFARVLEEDGGVAKVNSVCPGYVSSNLTRYTEYGATVEEGARRVVQMATLGEDGPTRTFSDLQGEIPW